MPRITRIKGLTTPRSEHVYNRLLVLARDMRSGEQLPTVRELMRRYSVSQLTIDRAIGRLKKQRFIEARAGRGLFATEHRSKGTVGLVMDEELAQFEINVLRQARMSLGEAGYDLRMATFRVDDGILPTLGVLACDALIVLPSSRRRVLMELSEARPASTPTVVLDLIPDGLELNAVATDNDHGGALAAKHLMDLGHRRIALVLSEPDAESRRARVAGFRRHAELAGAGAVEVEVIDCLAMIERQAIPIPDGTYGVARTGMTQILRERARLGFTAVFADSDLGALGVMRALHDARIVVPAAISVVGFDDLPAARYTLPSLTTVRQDLASWFTEALRILESRLAGHVGPAQHVRVRPELVVRESTGPCPQSETRHGP